VKGKEEKETPSKEKARKKASEEKNK